MNGDAFAAAERAGFFRKQTDADTVAETLRDLVPDVAQIRRRASRLIRCRDCDGLTIAYETPIVEAPLLWCRPEGGGDNWVVTWFAPFHFGPRPAWCKSRAYDMDEVIRERGMQPHGRDFYVSHAWWPTAMP